MNDYKYFDDLKIELIDGDRGKNYPRNDEMFDKGYCLFLNAKNVTINGFAFDENVFINREKDELLRKGKLSRNDIVLTTRGTIGNVGLYDDKIPYENIRINSGMLIIRNNDSNINTKYLYYQMTSPFIRNQIFNLKTGSAQPQIPITVLKKLKLLVPDKKNQDRIVKIMDSITGKIALNNSINNNLMDLSKKLYKEYFGKIPDTNIKKLGELCDIKYGKGLPTTKIEKEGYPVYGGNGIIGFYHEFMYDKSQVLVSCRGAASGNVIVSKPNSFVTNNSLILECDRKYHHYIKQYSLDNYYYEYTTGSAQPQITIDNIKDIVIKIPCDELLEQFNNQLEILEMAYFSNLEEISKLEQLRDTLLPKLMSNEINLDSIDV